jgi:putative exporter of polyketide antibiotics
MTNQNKRKLSGAFLLLGMALLVIGMATDNTIFSWAAIVFVLISLFLGGRWMRPRKR